MLRVLWSRSALRAFSSQAHETPAVTTKTEKPWENPWKHAAPEKKQTLTEYTEIDVDWSFVERILPRKTIPDIPEQEFPTPSGWMPPRDPPPALPYYVRRRRDHTLPLFLERRRDLLNEQTLDFDYKELVVLKNVEGDAFACEEDLRRFLEEKVGHPVATNVDEFKGIIKVKGADRTVLEQFLFQSGF